MSLIPKYAFRACAITALQHGAVSITGPCYQCGKEVSVAVEMTDLEKWRHGAYVQECFPYLGAAEREFLMSGICGQCWNEMFGDDEEEENPVDIREIKIVTKPYQKSPIYLKSIKRKKK